MQTDIQTPAILVDLDILEQNIHHYHQLAANRNKTLWPMIKTHKSTEIARIQLKHGATGFLCGTLDECEAIYENLAKGKNPSIGIMYAYPVASEPNISRVIELARQHNPFYIRIDSYEQAALLNQAATKADTCINCTVIVNSGLNRLGLTPHEAANLAAKLTGLKHMKFHGISTHPGHVYGETDSTGVTKIAAQETEAMMHAVAELTSLGITPKLITSGSTPTHAHAANSTVINCLHPGNYVFMDNMQIALGCATQEDCALTILTTIISAPRPGEYIIDAGSKCLGLDKGAHGNTKIKGYGRIKNLDENMAQVSALSEEVGKITVDENYRDKINLNIGNKIEIIPNHACAAANNTSHYVAMRKGVFDRLINVDMRGNSSSQSVARISIQNSR